MPKAVAARASWSAGRRSPLQKPGWSEAQRSVPSSSASVRETRTLQQRQSRIALRSMRDTGSSTRILVQPQPAWRREPRIAIAAQPPGRIDLDAAVAPQVLAPLAARRDRPPVDRRTIFRDVALHARRRDRVAVGQRHRLAGAPVAPASVAPGVGDHVVTVAWIERSEIREIARHRPHRLCFAPSGLRRASDSPNNAA
jgi:hypothetical protein